MPDNFNPDYYDIRREFSRSDLRRVCQMRESEFEDAYAMTKETVLRRGPENWYLFKDNGSDVLAVAHLDTVSNHAGRTCRFVNTADGTVVFSRALDDRLGAYIILELLPKLGITYDVLLTVGEESGQSTAEFFTTEKEYRYMIEFDRGGTDVVMYQYEDSEVRQMVRDCGATPATGIFSDISYLEHLGIKGFNWGVGYQDYHGPRSHAFLEDTFEMVECYLEFHRQNEDVAMPHYESYDTFGGYGSFSGGGRGGFGRYGGHWWDDAADPYPDAIPDSVYHDMINEGDDLARAEGNS